MDRGAGRVCNSDLRSMCPSSVQRGGPSVNLRQMRSESSPLQLSAPRSQRYSSLGVGAGVCFVVSLVCMVHGADVCVYRPAKRRDKTVGVKDLCLFAVCFLLFGGGSRSGGSFGVLGAAVPQIVSPTVRGGPWAPPPRFAFL